MNHSVVESEETDQDQLAHSSRLEMGGTSEDQGPEQALQTALHPDGPASPALDKPSSHASVSQDLLRTKSFAFALRIVKLYQYLDKQNESVMSKQLLHAGTAIGALVRETEQVSNPAEQARTLALALKRAHETEYWLELLHQSDYINAKGFASIHPDIVELIQLLTASVRSAKVHS